MVKSMTGFGRAENTKNGITVLAEVRSVNHRFFEFSMRCPRSCQFLEDTVKKTLRGYMVRGKVDLSLTVTADSAGASSVTLDREYAAAYITALRELAREFKLKNDLTVSAVASNPEIFTVKKAELDEKLLTEAVIEAVSGAAEALVEMRAAEGEKLALDISSRADTLLAAVELIEKRSPDTVNEYRERLTARIRELLDGHEPDEQRIVTEAAVYADKVAVAEETVRLRSHVAQLKDMLAGDGEVGRRLDFLVQEMNRETNTIGSKAQDTEIARTVVDMKAEIEKIREQIQNIE